MYAVCKSNTYAVSHSSDAIRPVTTCSTSAASQVCGVLVLLIAGHVSASEAAALRRALAQREDELNRVRRGLAGASQVHPRNHMSALSPVTLHEEKIR